MGRLTAVSPASIDDCLDMGGSRALARKVLLLQREKGDSIAFHDDGVVVAIGFLVPTDAGEIEFALSIRAGARARLVTLCRIAHLTLRRLAETGAVVICHVSPGNRAGQRMARLTGFSPDGETRWKWSGRDGSSDEPFRRREQRGKEGSEAEPGNPGGGE